MKTYQNLLPGEFRQRLLISVRLRQWCKIWGVTGLVLSTLGLGIYSGNDRLQHDWNALNERTSPIVQTKLKNDALAKQRAELDEKLAMIDDVNDAGHHLTLIGMIGRSVRHTGESIQIQSCTFHEIAPAADKAKAVKRRNQRAKADVPVIEKTMRIDLRGVSLDEGSIARFINTLKTIDAFTHVELKTVRGTEISNQPLRMYQIECAL